ncbi:LPXTG cell wall anchor domain-containing protein [Staphylococcus agnetis]|uniref:LPXTG cell wall anchor domain-containing protein n=2 Tax=Staphylococcus agnetis TaxID=985762 RepID=A0AAW9YWM5_9STAP|nr:LPXTG cell wall anchor domain-containing protein [Staphylococcus agnetis]
MTTDYITEQHLIEYQEELHIKRGSHKNIWFEEDTNEDKPSIQTGAHHPIKIQDNTLPKVSGETKGVITEEDSKPSPLPKHSNENNLEVPQPPVAPKGNEQMEKDQHQSAPKIKDNSKIKQHRKISKEEINHQKKVTPQIKSETPKNKKEINTTPSLNDNHRQGSTEMTKNIKMTHKDYKESHRPSLPETGQSSNHHSYIIGTVLSFFGFSFIVRRKCEKRH